MTHRRRTAVLLFGIASIAACDDADGRARIEPVDSAGVAIVRNTASDLSADVTFSEVRRLGGRDTDEESFYVVTRNTTGTDRAGNIHVLDRQSFRVQVFDSAGRHLRTLGREGGGPGELQFPLSLSVTHDGIVRVADVGKQAFVRWGPDGAILESEPLPTGYFGGEVQWSPSGIVVPLRSAEQNRLVLVSADDTVTLADIPRGTPKAIQLESCGMGFTGMDPLFSPDLVWAAWGDTVAVARNPEYVIDIYEAGRLVRSIRRDVQPRPATAALARESLGEGMKVQMGSGSGGQRVCDPDEVVEKQGFAEFLPTISRIAISPKGMLWVQRFDVGDGPRSVDMFDADGSYIGSLEDSAMFPIAFMPDGRFLTTEKDELDVQRLVLRSMTR